MRESWTGRVASATISWRKLMNAAEFGCLGDIMGLFKGWVPLTDLIRVSLHELGLGDESRKGAKTERRFLWLMAISDQAINEVD
jgi:hypothetical protein